MPKVGDYPKSGTANPHLHLLQVEINILDNAAGLCESIAKYVEGHNPEFAVDARQVKDRLLRLAESKHQDLTKPF